MAQTTQKYLGKSKYKGVFIIKQHEIIKYAMDITIKGVKVRKIYHTEEEAGKAADMFLIKNGKEPVNILKRK